MGFDEFLDSLGMTQSAFDNLQSTEQNYIQQSYNISMQRASKSQQAEQLKNMEEENERARAREKAEKEKKEAFYKEWADKFNHNAGNLAKDTFKTISGAIAKNNLDQVNKSKEELLNRVRKSCEKHPEKLLFAEAEVLSNSIKMESWIRMIPVGTKWAGEVSYAEMLRGDKTLREYISSDANERLDVDQAMYSYLLKRYDSEPLPKEGLNPSDPDYEKKLAGNIARDIYKNTPESLAFYEEHRLDDTTYVNSDNLDFTMKEVFRLGERMSRNRRGSKPMKELCAKIKSLQTDYTKNPSKYKEMPMGQLNNLMQSIMLSADAYVNAKKNQGSYSSTQLERLKCINQLKTLRESFVSNAEKSETLHTAPSYQKQALAEKLVLAEHVGTKLGNMMTNRAEIQKLTQEKIADPAFDLFLKSTITEVRKQNGEAFAETAVYDQLLKTKGQKLNNIYQKFYTSVAKTLADKKNSAEQSKPAEKKEEPKVVEEKKEEIKPVVNEVPKTFEGKAELAVKILKEMKNKAVAFKNQYFDPQKGGIPLTIESLNDPVNKVIEGAEEQYQELIDGTNDVINRINRNMMSKDSLISSRILQDAMLGEVVRTSLQSENHTLTDSMRYDGLGTRGLKTLMIAEPETRTQFFGKKVEIVEKTAQNGEKVRFEHTGVTVEQFIDNVCNHQFAKVTPDTLAKIEEKIPAVLDFYKKHNDLAPKQPRPKDKPIEKPAEKKEENKDVKKVENKPRKKL